MTLKERLEAVFDPAKHTKADLARAAKVRPPSVSEWFSGKSVSMKGLTLLRAAAYLEVNALWLATGEGPRSNAYAVGRESAPLIVADQLPTYGQSPARWPFSRELLSALEGLDQPEVNRLENSLRALLALPALPPAQSPKKAA